MNITKQFRKVSDDFFNALVAFDASPSDLAMVNEIIGRVSKKVSKYQQVLNTAEELKSELQSIFTESPPEQKENGETN